MKFYSKSIHHFSRYSQNNICILCPSRHQLYYFSFNFDLLQSFTVDISPVLFTFYGHRFRSGSKIPARVLVYESK